MLAFGWLIIFERGVARFT